MSPRLLRSCSAWFLALVGGAAGASAQSTQPQPGRSGAVPIPLFSSEPRVGAAPLTVRFTDMSRGDISTWHWKFGDGSTSLQQNPVHVYQSMGTYSVALTTAGRAGTKTLRKDSLIQVGSCGSGNARLNSVLPLEIEADFIPINGDDTLGFYCVYSGKRSGMLSDMPVNNVGIFLFDLGGSDVLVFGSGYGDVPGPEGALYNAEHDARQMDEVLQWCMGKKPSTTKLRFVAPHGHPDHLNPPIVREIERLGYGVTDIYFHEADSHLVDLLNWSQSDRKRFRLLSGNICGEELLSFDSPLGRIWFYLRPGHTPGSIDLVLDALGDTENRVVVLGSLSNQACMPPEGVRETIAAHGNVMLDAIAPLLGDVSPQRGSAMGGALITLSGSNFLAARAGDPMVSFDGTAVSAKVIDDSTIVCESPPGAPAQTVAVRLTNNNGSFERPAAFTYHPLPLLSNLEPENGSVLGGTRVTLEGSGFMLFQAGETSVTFGGSRATDLLLLDDNTLSCKTPLGSPSTTVAVRLSNRNGSSTLPAAFSFNGTLAALSVLPAEGSPIGGTLVSVRGSGFLNGAKGAPQVTFDGKPASDVEVLDDLQLRCTTPPGIGGAAVAVQVRNQNGITRLLEAFHYYPNPRVDSVTPDLGPHTGGTDVAINGQGFVELAAGSAQVHFDGLAATDVRVLNDTRLRCTAPPGKAGAQVLVSVSNANGTGSREGAFRYEPVLIATSFLPASGSAIGGTQVSIEGEGFQVEAGTTSVLFGGLPATSIQVHNDTQLTCIAPGGIPGSQVGITLQNELGTSNFPLAFRFHALPVLIGLAPISGPGSGGTSVLLLGEGFKHSAVTWNEVLFAEEAALDVEVVSDSFIRCRTPSGMPGSSIDVRVRNSNGEALLASAFRYNDPPKITSVDPGTAALNTPVAVTIRGSGFASTDSGTPIVRFDQRDATNVVVLSDSRITCTSPRGLLGKVDVSLENKNGLAILRNSFVIIDKPLSIRSTAPSSGIAAGGTLIRIEGSGFRPDQADRTSLLIGAKAALQVVILDEETIECRIPAGTPNTQVPIEIRSPAGYALSLAGWRYRALPTIDLVSPNTGPLPGGDRITLEGQGFLFEEAGTNVILFGSTPASELQLISDNRIVCTNPAGPSGRPIDITIRNANGESTLVGGFEYTAPKPQFTSLSPQAGSALGGVSVMLTGKGFTKRGAGELAVFFGSEPASDIQILNDTSALCSAPPGSPESVVDVTLGNQNGEALLEGAFRYHAAPKLVSLSPPTGRASGGTLITLLGSGFVLDGAGANVVELDGVALANVVILDDTQLSFTTPAGTPGGALDVRLSNANGEALLPGAFTYFAPAPTLSHVEPPSVSSLQPAVVTVHGSGFERYGASLPELSFGSLSATAIAVIDNTTLRCTPPMGAAGTTLDLTLTNSSGSAALEGALRIHALPTLVGATPERGSALGGLEVALLGSGFERDGAGANSVLFDGQVATNIAVLSDTEITCNLPPGAAGTTVAIELRNANGSGTLSDAFSFNPEPTLTSITPSFGPLEGRTRVTLRGLDLASNLPGTATILFGGLKARNLQVVDESTMECDTPDGKGLVDVEFNNVNGSTRLEAAFLFGRPPPTLSALTPSSGAGSGGTLVTLTGSGFAADSNLSLRFGANVSPSVTILDENTLECITPSGPMGSIDVLLTNDFGSAALSGAYTFLGLAPTISSLQPRKGPANGGTTVTLLGTGFAGPVGGAPEIYFGSVAATQVVLHSSTRMICTTPAGAPNSNTNVTVQNENGSTVFLRAYRYTAQQEVTTLTPPRGPARGEQPTILSGSGFELDQDVEVLFDAEPASDVRILDTNRIALRTPVGSTGNTARVRFFVDGHEVGELPYRYDPSVRDLNADGVEDWIGPHADGGELHVRFGGHAASFARVGGTQRNELGHAFQVGDLDSDGIVDLIVAAPREGLVALLPGPLDTGSHAITDGQRLLPLVAPEAELGSALQLVDLDLDGQMELLVGAPGAAQVSVLTNAPLAAKSGNITASAPRSVIVIQAPPIDVAFGASLLAMDVDEDGWSEWFASAPKSERGGAAAGALFGYVPMGLPRAADQALWQWVGDETGAEFGARFLLGHFDDAPASSQGLDLIVLAPGSRSPSSSGGALVLFHEAFDTDSPYPSDRLEAHAATWMARVPRNERDVLLLGNRAHTWWVDMWSGGQYELSDGAGLVPSWPGGLARPVDGVAIPWEGHPAAVPTLPPGEE